MEHREEKTQAALDCLNFNKHLDTVHVTSDLNCFINQGDAINHARGLADKTVDVFTRDGADGAVQDVLHTVIETIKAKTIPDADLAKEKKNGGAKAKSFDKVKKAPATDPAPVYGTEGKKPAAVKKAAAPKADAKPADANSTDQQSDTENQA